MGSTLVQSAFLVGQVRKIQHKSFRLLVHMAMTALDQEKDGKPPRLYWKGRQAQAFALGYTPFDCDTPGARSNVSKTVQDLVDRGLIEKLNGGFNGRQATYQLLLHGDVASADLYLARRVAAPVGDLVVTARGSSRASAR